jgi:hypothetical protein
MNPKIKEYPVYNFVFVTVIFYFSNSTFKRLGFLIIDEQYVKVQIWGSLDFWQN